MARRAHWGGAFCMAGSDDLQNAERRGTWWKRPSVEDDFLPAPRVRATDGPVIPDDCIFPNMDELPELSSEAVLENLDRLFVWPQDARPGDGDPPCNNVYSSVGPVLIAMNPFAPLPIYGWDWIRAYRDLGKTGRIDMSSQTLGPHCYAVAEQAYQQLREVRHQSIIICGESGAGKTETNKLMLEYLLDAESFCEKSNIQGAAEATDKRKRRVAQANLLMESFGNAPTMRNSNSSRFGKFSQLLFDNENFTIKSFHIETTLLERSRIVFEPPGERNFFIFHQLVRSDLPPNLGLIGGPEAFAYTRSGAGVLRVDGSEFNDAADFVQLCDQMDAAGFSAENRQHIFEAVAAVLHLGNIDFDGDDDDSTVSSASEPSLKRVCELLGFGGDSAPSVAEALITTTTGGKVSITKTLGVNAARAQRDAFAKVLYAGIFADIVRQININVGQGARSTASIGLLDIFGFEDMPLNSLEQMYINLTNERIQHLFNSIMFDREMQIYMAEGLQDACNFESGESNWPCIELFISGPSCKTGIVKLLADQCKVKAGRENQDKLFLNNLMKHLKAGHSHFVACTPGQEFNKAVRLKKKKWQSKLLVPDLYYGECFRVKHYAGDVIYTVNDFVAKSKDALPVQWARIFETSSRSVVRSISDTAGAQTSLATVGEKLVEQLTTMTQKLEQGGSHFVRCIKPNSEAVPGLFDRELVLEQLKCGGVVAALEMRRVGYPDRMDFAEFCDKFWILQTGWRRPGLEDRRYCEELLRDFVSDGQLCSLGRTKVFFKNGVLKDLREKLHFRTLLYAIAAQRKFRTQRGTQQMYVITTERQRLQDLEEQVRSKGLTECQAVVDAMRCADEAMTPLWEALERSKSEHEAEASVQLAIGRDLKSRGRDMPKLRNAVNSVDAAIRNALHDQSSGERAMAMKLQEKNKEKTVLHVRFLTLMEDCAASPLPQRPCTWSVSPEFLRCVEAVRTARSKTEDMLRPDVMSFCKSFVSRKSSSSPTSASRAQGSCTPTGHDASEVEALAGQLQERLDESAKSLEVLEECARDLHKARQHFEKQVSASRAKQAEALARLSKCKEEAEEAIREGFDGMAEALHDAWQLDEIANSVAKGAQDIPAFENAVCEFVEAVSKANAKVNEGRALWKRHQREQVREHGAAICGLQAGPTFCNAATAFLGALAEVERELCISKSVPEGISDELRAKLQGIRESLHNLDISDVPRESPPIICREGYQIEIGVHSASASTADSPLAIGESACSEWGTSQAIRLQSIPLERLETLGKMLDKGSVSLVVSGLNSGIIRCDTSFCIAFSQRYGAYFLLYRRGQHQAACEMVETYVGG